VVNRQLVRISNAHEDDRFYQNVEQVTRFTTQSMLAIPLITKDKIVGVLEAINKCEGDFTDDDEDLLLTLGTQAAVAIENTRLFQQSDLVAEFVHELRTPLASIGTSTYLLLRPEISQEQRDSMVKGIQSETLRLSSLASSFLDLARLESGRVQFHMDKFELAPLLEECRLIMQGKADESSIALKVEIPADFPPVEGDRDKVKQLVINLVSNAIKYNCPKGSVTVSAGIGKKEWTLCVADTGMGIPENALPHLFEKFFRVRASEGKVAGTGLGLSICKQIVSGHGGSIEVKSKLGAGTTFAVHFPNQKK